MVKTLVSTGKNRVLLRKYSPELITWHFQCISRQFNRGTIYLMKIIQKIKKVLNKFMNMLVQSIGKCYMHEVKVVIIISLT